MNRNLMIIVVLLITNLVFAVVFDSGLLHAFELSFFQAIAVGLTALFYEKELKYAREGTDGRTSEADH